ncbi:MAG: DUF2807 domain-containing protein [Bacteroidaceae bacterium]|nr:DUF2807 domain-containing protein [Bacteroidaceae bacterium]
MKTNIIIATLAACMLLYGNPLMGQGFSLSNLFGNNNKIEASKKTVTYELENPERFNRIQFAGSGTVEYRQSSDGQTRVVVTIAENVRDYVEVEVKNGTLSNRWKAINTTITGDSKLKIVCESPQIEVVSLAGSGKAYLMNTITDRRLALKVAGSGSIKTSTLHLEENLQCDVAGSGHIEVGEGNTGKTASFDIAGSGEIHANRLKAKEVAARISGSGDINLQGTAQKANLQTTGCGEIHAHELKAENVYAKVTGSGDIDCYVTKELTTKVTGSGEITYSGNPSVINSNNVKKSNKKQVDTEEVMEGL